MKDLKLTVKKIEIKNIIMLGFLVLLIISNIVTLYYTKIEINTGKETNNIIQQLLEKEDKIVYKDRVVYKSEIPFTRLGKFKLSFYSPHVCKDGLIANCVTATGTKPKANHTIAVDPNIIPKGSIVYIKGYGYFIAEDTGGDIKSNRIDIFMNTKEEAKNHGIKYADVYLLRY